MKRSLLFTLFSLLFFALGFLSHALFFPDFLSNGIISIPKVAPLNTSPTEAAATDPLITNVYFDKGKFSRTNIQIGFTRYIQIINKSETTPMHLVSTEPSLSTTRGYGHTEAVKMQFNKKGQFVVADKNNPEERLVITVK